MIYIVLRKILLIWTQLMVQFSIYMKLFLSGTGDLYLKQYSGNSGMLRLGRIKIGNFETNIETAFLAFLKFQCHMGIWIIKSRLCRNPPMGSSSLQKCTTKYLAKFLWEPISTPQSIVQIWKWMCFLCKLLSVSAGLSLGELPQYLHCKSEERPPFT